MNALAWIDKAGSFPVIRKNCPHFQQQVLWSAPPAGIIHTTEGSTEEGALSVFREHFAPHFTLGYDRTENKVEIFQLVPIGFIGAAIVTHNNLARVQVEVVGFSKETPWIFDDQTLDALASLMSVCKAEWDIPLSRPWPDGVYGKARADDPHRAEGKFGKIAGWYGHGDMPAPDSHWDPGNLQWSKVFGRAKALSAAVA